MQVSALLLRLGRRLLRVYNIGRVYNMLWMISCCCTHIVTQESLLCFVAQIVRICTQLLVGAPSIGA